MTLSGRTSWIVVAALVVSLCINSFFVGAILTRPGPHDGPHPPEQPRAELAQTAGLARILGNLPPPIRDFLRDEFETLGADIPGMNRALRQARRDVVAVLRAEPLDMDALDAALAAVRSRTTELQVALHAMFVTAMQDMPPEMRAEAVEIWSRQR
ncbi:MAG: periplasmic heavy metal sensor [Alphaproteobacteria bacterium]